LHQEINSPVMWFYRSCYRNHIIPCVWCEAPFAPGLEWLLRRHLYYF
jgi:hypothetical protein